MKLKHKKWLFILGCLFLLTLLVMGLLKWQALKTLDHDAVNKEGLIEQAGNLEQNDATEAQDDQEIKDNQENLENSENPDNQDAQNNQDAQDKQDATDNSNGQDDQSNASNDNQSKPESPPQASMADRLIIGEIGEMNEIELQVLGSQADERLTLQVAIKNGSTNLYSIDQTHFYLREADGTKHEPVLSDYDKSTRLESVKLYEGGVTKGTLSFEMPQVKTDTVLVFEPYKWSDDHIEVVLHETMDYKIVIAPSVKPTEQIATIEQSLEIEPIEIQVDQFETILYEKARPNKVYQRIHLKVINHGTEAFTFTPQMLQMMGDDGVLSPALGVAWAKNLIEQTDIGPNQIIEGYIVFETNVASQSTWLIYQPYQIVSTRRLMVLQ